jgi:SAM-dependent methyltransferase
LKRSANKRPLIFIWSVVKHLIKRILPERLWQSLRASWLRASWGALIASQATVRGWSFATKTTRAGATSSTPSSEHPDIANPFEKYFDSHIEGRGIWKWRHYFPIYHRHLQKFVGQDAHILEIGVYSGGSLEMLQIYFGSRSHIYGVDIEPSCKSYETDAVKIFIGDQADRSFWTQVKHAVPVLDVIIDDGGHKAHQQIATLEEMLAHLRPGGIYICEDVHGTCNEFADYIHGITKSLNETTLKGGAKRDLFDLAVSPTEFQSSIYAVHHYPFMVVIEKTDSPVTEFVAPRHGTEWQPPTFWEAAQKAPAPGRRNSHAYGVPGTGQAFLVYSALVSSSARSPSLDFHATEFT